MSSLSLFASQGASRKRLMLVALTFLIAGVLLFWSVRGISWASVFTSIRRADPRFVVAFLLLGSVALFLRALRWRVLLNAEARIPMSLVFWATAAGYFGNNFLPARAGEVVRLVLVRSQSSLSASYILATVGLERMADAVTLVVVMGAVLLFLPGVPPWLLRPVVTLGVVSGVGACGLVVIPKLGPWIAGWISRVRLPEDWKLRLKRVLQEVTRGLVALHQRHRFLSFAALTLAIWTLDALATIVCSRALGLRFPLPLAFLLIAAIGLGSAVPAPPGYVGVYQFIAVSVLQPFGFSRTQAVAYILYVQFLSYLIIGVWGSVGFIRLRRAPAARAEV